ALPTPIPTLFRPFPRLLRPTPETVTSNPSAFLRTASALDRSLGLQARLTAPFPFPPFPTHPAPANNMLRAVLSPFSKTSRAVVLGSTLFSVAFGMNIIQTLTLVLAPFSQRLTIKVNSMVVGAIWMYMQVNARSSRSCLSGGSGGIPSHRRVL
ncbi:MAG: hypothetical protein BJ554DRAFT_5165, partial [Olpidium bornovanus]